MLPSPARRLFPFVLAVACAVVMPALAHATTILRIEDLPALVEEARRAVLAEVVDVRYGLDEREMHSTWVTLRIEEPLFGRVPRRGQDLVIKIYGAPVPMPDGSRVFIEGTPRYRPGDRYVLLLLDDSPWGFTDTAGLYQGAFRIARGSDGRDMAESLAGNRSVFGRRGLGRWIAPAEVDPVDLPHLDRAGGPVPYALLRRTIERLAGGRSAEPGPNGR